MVIDYRKACYDLWRILDDIDTASDAAKSDDVGYRKYVEERQGARWRVLGEQEVKALYDDFFPCAQAPPPP